MRGTDGKYVGLTSLSSGMICLGSPPKYAITPPTSKDRSWMSSAKAWASGR